VLLHSGSGSDLTIFLLILFCCRSRLGCQAILIFIILSGSCLCLCLTLIFLIIVLFTLFDLVDLSDLSFRKIAKLDKCGILCPAFSTIFAALAFKQS